MTTKSEELAPVNLEPITPRDHLEAAVRLVMRSRYQSVLAGQLRDVGRLLEEAEGLTRFLPEGEAGAALRNQLNAIDSRVDQLRHALVAIIEDLDTPAEKYRAAMEGTN